MSSHTGPREDGRRLSLRTLAIASIASATAAVVTSLFWKGGTPIAAAVTPVLVALVSEMLHRPAEKIATRLTAETDALPAEAAGAGAPPARGMQRDEPPAREIGAARREQTAVREERLRTLSATSARSVRSPGEPDMKVYRASTRRPRLAWKPIAATAAIAFVIAAALLTLPELIAGQSFGQGDNRTTFFGGSGSSDSTEQGADPQQDPEAQPQEPAPEPNGGDSQDAPQPTEPAEPPADEPAPEPGQTPAPSSPAPAAPGEPTP